MGMNVLDIKERVRSFTPSFLISLYHASLAYISAIWYGSPSRSLLVIGVTGTKGKSSTTEMINAIFEEAGHKTAVLNSIRMKVANESKPNTMRMSMPGRFFIQRFLSRAHTQGCTVAILEMTSEGARLHRHRAIALDALVFTNLAPEHIESHGSYEAYADAKFSIGKQLARSGKKFRVMVANADDPGSERYLKLPIEKTVGYSLKTDKSHLANENGGHFLFNDMTISVKLPGNFSLENALAAASLADAFGIGTPTIVRALGKISRIPGRAEKVEAGQDFTVVVDYAHTADSLKALYDAYRAKRKICVLGATGGGRDKWKRPVMGKAADENCDEIILTNEDPYDEDPKTIIDELASGMKRKAEVILDRRRAIARGISLARAGDAVLITGKGTDPTIQGPHHSAEAWSDARVAHEEIENLLRTKQV
jgi:UDP-N-acetylmuramoyl-L-alanyl-D-glutamate--2,6-diaminopimelate ligase